MANECALEIELDILSHRAATPIKKSDPHVILLYLSQFNPAKRKPNPLEGRHLKPLIPRTLWPCFVQTSPAICQFHYEILFCSALAPLEESSMKPSTHTQQRWEKLHRGVAVPLRVCPTWASEGGVGSGPPRLCSVRPRCSRAGRRLWPGCTGGRDEKQVKNTQLTDVQTKTLQQLFSSLYSHKEP